ncbi:MAG: hypothetical protein WBS24_10965 [Terriglobales bacterium]
MAAESWLVWLCLPDPYLADPRDGSVVAPGGSIGSILEFAGDEAEVNQSNCGFEAARCD